MFMCLFVFHTKWSTGAAGSSRARDYRLSKQFRVVLEVPPKWELVKVIDLMTRYLLECSRC
jgi:hypothetical protein